MAIIVVTHDSVKDLPGLANELIDQLREDDELIIVDNGSTDGTPQTARALLGRATVIETGGNVGFGAGCLRGVNVTSAPLLVFLNPDSRPYPHCLESLRRAMLAHPQWAAWQAAVLLDADHVNTSGGIIHYLGIGWAGECGQPISVLAANDREIAYPSGAAMVVRREAWQAVGGMDPDYFMYSEDLDIGLRLWLAGHHIGVVPSARVSHSYEFDKGPYKWFWMERNRWRTVLSVYPTPLLLLLAPALLAAELGLLAIAARQGWLRPKLRAQLATIRELPQIAARRRRVQPTRQIGVAEFASHLTSSLDNPYLGGAAQNRFLSNSQALYWGLVTRVLAILD